MHRRYRLIAEAADRVGCDVNGYCESFNGKLRDEVLERRTVLFHKGGADRDRTVAGAIQHAEAAFLAGLPATGAGSLSPRQLHERHTTVAGRDVKPSLSLVQNLGQVTSPW